MDDNAAAGVPVGEPTSGDGPAPSAARAASSVPAASVPAAQEPVTAATGPASSTSAGSDGGRSAKSGKEKKPAPPGSIWRELPILIVVAVALAILLKTFLLQAFFIPSGSMENTLQVGDRVMVNKVVYHLRDIKRGDIVVFDGLDSWTPEVTTTQPTNPIAKAASWFASLVGFAPPSEKDFIKRVIGVPGDHVTCCDAKGRVSVNGVPLDETEYLYPGNKPSEQPFDVTVPAGRLWVMGDHRAMSSDSRAHLGDPGGGTIPEDRVIGRAFVVIWPVSHWSWLSNPSTFDQPALEKSAALAADSPLALGFVGALPLVALRRSYLRRRWRRLQRGAAPAAGGRAV
jgi:signal peptidase I